MLIQIELLWWHLRSQAVLKTYFQSQKNVLTLESRATLPYIVNIENKDHLRGVLLNTTKVLLNWVPSMINFIEEVKRIT